MSERSAPSYTAIGPSDRKVEVQKLLDVPPAIGCSRRALRTFLDIDRMGGLNVRVPVQVTNQETERGVSLDFRLLSDSADGSPGPRTRNRTAPLPVDIAPMKTAHVDLTFHFHDLKVADLMSGDELHPFRENLWRLVVIDRVSGQEHEINLPTTHSEVSGYLAMYQADEPEADEEDKD